MRDEGIPLCPIERAAERHTMVSTFLDIAAKLHDLYLPDVEAGKALESVVLAAWVFRGHVEGRPLTIAKLAHVSGLSPTTVRRKLEPLITNAVVERRQDGTYAMCEPRVNNPAIMAKVSRIVASLVLAARTIEKATNADALTGTTTRAMLEAPSPTP
jgi:hypothetical protein